MIKNISNLGDAALYCDFGDEVNKKINSSVIKYFKNLRKNRIDGITNITPSYNKLIISFDLEIINYEKLKEKIDKINIKDIDEDKKNIIKIPLCIDSEFSLDLKRLSDNLKITEEEIIKSFFSTILFSFVIIIIYMPWLIIL